MDYTVFLYFEDGDTQAATFDNWNDASEYAEEMRQQFGYTAVEWPTEDVEDYAARWEAEKEKWQQERRDEAKKQRIKERNALQVNGFTQAYIFHDEETGELVAFGEPGGGCLWDGDIKALNERQDAGEVRILAVYNDVTGWETR